MFKIVFRVEREESATAVDKPQFRIAGSGTEVFVFVRECNLRE